MTYDRWRPGRVLATNAAVTMLLASTTTPLSSSLHFYLTRGPPLAYLSLILSFLFSFSVTVCHISHLPLAPASSTTISFPLLSPLPLLPFSVSSISLPLISHSLLVSFSSLFTFIPLSPSVLLSDSTVKLLLASAEGAEQQHRDLAAQKRSVR